MKCSGSLAQWVRALAAKLDNPSWMPGTHMVGESYKLFSRHVSCHAHAWVHMYTHTQTKCKKKKLIP